MMKRLFAAIKIQPGEEVLTHYYQLRRKLQQDKINWVDPDNFHLTLKFFGETDESEIDNISKVFDSITAKISPFNIKLSKTGIFGSKYSPRVIWLGFDEEKELKHLGNSVLRECDRNGYVNDRQNFVPHLTIGRIKAVSSKEIFQKAIKDSLSFDSELIQLSGITLFESILRRSGPKYNALENYSFVS